VLERLTRAAIFQALADVRIGAIPAAMRLLVIAPSRSPGGTPAASEGRDAQGDEDGALPEAMRDVRLDEEGERVASDGLPATSGCPLGVA
jgi:hypothetical protein